MADAPREGGGAAPVGGATSGSPQAETATGGGPAAETSLPEAFPAGSQWSRLGGRFERALSLSRIVVVVPVVVLLLSAMASFAYGTDVFVRSVASVVENPELTSQNLGFLL